MNDATETKAMRQAKEDIIEMLLEWMGEAEAAGQSPAPIHFSMIVRDDITLRDALEIARGKRICGMPTHMTGEPCQVPRPCQSHPEHPVQA